MVPRGRGFGRQIQNVGPIAAADRRAVVVVEFELRNDESSTTPLSPMPRSCKYFESTDERVVPYDSPKRNCGEFQRLKCVRYRWMNWPNAATSSSTPQKSSRVPGADDAAETAARHIDEDQVGLVEQRVAVVDEPIRRRTGQIVPIAGGTRTGPNEPIRSHIVELPGPPL